MGKNKQKPNNVASGGTNPTVQTPVEPTPPKAPNQSKANRTRPERFADISRALNGCVLEFLATEVLTPTNSISQETRQAWVADTLRRLQVEDPNWQEFSSELGQSVDMMLAIALRRLQAERDFFMGVVR